MTRSGGIPAEALLDLRRRLDQLPSRHLERRALIESAVNLFGVSRASVYRALSSQPCLKAVTRMDKGQPRKIDRAKLLHYCEIIAALKIRTSNRKGRHISTARAIELLEEHGVETPEGLVQAPECLLSKSIVNRYLKLWGYDHTRMTRPPVSVRFEAEHSNAMWQFDISPSDLKEIEQPVWIDPNRKGTPTPMLFSVVDDRSGTTYQEYRCVYGEDTETGLRFMFNAMAPKKRAGLSLQGIPDMLYMDNGPIAKSHLFQRVMGQLGVKIMTHQPAGHDGRRTTARSKGKVERPFRTVKEAHEVLYHFHKPQTEQEANDWLAHYIEGYNNQPHRREPHSRIEDWVKNLPANGLRQMCSWERFCTFARDPETRKVAGDARISIGGTYYEVDPDLAGEKVTLWWGLFDNEVFVEFGDKRYGPYAPSGGPIPLHRYRKPKKTETQKRADRIDDLAGRLSVPRSALGGSAHNLALVADILPFTSQAFVDPDPYGQFTYASRLEALRGVSDLLHRPLARLAADDLDFVNSIVAQTLDKAGIETQLRSRFYPKRDTTSSEKDPEC